MRLRLFVVGFLDFVFFNACCFVIVLLCYLLTVLNYFIILCLFNIYCMFAFLCLVRCVFVMMLLLLLYVYYCYLFVFVVISMFIICYNIL